MYEPKWKHRECPGGCGQMADECECRTPNWLGAFQYVEAAAPSTDEQRGKK